MTISAVGWYELTDIMGGHSTRIDIGLDFETYGERDLKTVGLDNYLADPNFRPLIASVATYVRGQYFTHTFDFMTDPRAEERFLSFIERAEGYAHNAPFERGVMSRAWPELIQPTLLDTAVIARCLGADSHLEKAAPQLLAQATKMPEGKRLIKKFSVPQEDGTSLAATMAAAGTLATDPDWLLFKMYCETDALLSYRLGQLRSRITAKERAHERYTYQMNQYGWKVDLAAVQEMQRRYEENKELALHEFQIQHDKTGDLNFNSTPQLKKWCEVRGVKSSSFDEAHVDKLIPKLLDKILTLSTDDPKLQGYSEVYAMLKTKKTLGGSSLKKLLVLQRLVGEDGILRNQYMHAGAGQTYRTSGRGVQMQNLKRLSSIADMSELEDDDTDWDNDKLAENLRQVFTARHPQGALIVGDFKSVENRGLAWLAGETWKLDAIAADKDLYKVLAQQIYHVDYDKVTKEQRQTGKVGELSCGYGAGGPAVQAFAEKMGVFMPEQETAELVRGWRAANSKIVDFWQMLDDGLREAMSTDYFSQILPNGYEVRLSTEQAPVSLERIHPGAKTLTVTLLDPYQRIILSRVFQGAYLRGRGVCFYKSSQTADKLWVPFYMDPKTKQRKFYSIYGGKLAGILTQSLCREIFFEVLGRVMRYAESRPEINVVGQFHDEIVVDYAPVGLMSLSTMEDKIEQMMSATRLLGFPLAADVKSGYRYIK